MINMKIWLILSSFIIDWTFVWHNRFNTAFQNQMESFCINKTKKKTTQKQKQQCDPFISYAFPLLSITISYIQSHVIIKNFVIVCLLLQSTELNWNEMKWIYQTILHFPFSFSLDLINDKIKIQQKKPNEAKNINDPATGTKIL